MQLLTWGISPTNVSSATKERAKEVRTKQQQVEVSMLNTDQDQMLSDLAIGMLVICRYLNALAANGSPVQELRRWRFNADGRLQPRW